VTVTAGGQEGGIAVDDGASVDLASHAFRLIVTGGGSGGHTYPALATVRALRSRLAAYGGKLEVTWVGTAGSLEERTAAGEGITFRAVATGKLRRARNPGFIGAELPDVLALADVMVSRSGAGTLAEITALGNAAVLIPLASSAGDEQRHNARYLTDLGAAVACSAR
jgi:UDP-N-acetylglucosamine:LPS N-acetylglucosamine transferase